MTEAFSIDLKAYLARIGESGSVSPDLPTLQRVTGAHARSIPFENLDILLGKGISVEPADVEHKLVREHRGGYCFEQNTLLLHALLALGFSVRPISARVRFGVPRHTKTPRTHLFLLVTVQGEPWLADAGVGSMTLTSALRLELDTPQPTPHETRRIVATGDWDGLERRSPDALLYHQVLLDGAWEDICEFTLEEMHPTDRELANWFTSTHPASHFRSQLKAAIATETGRVTILDRTWKRRAADGSSATRTLETPEELLEVLATDFGLHFPAGTRFECAAWDDPIPE